MTTQPRRDAVVYELRAAGAALLGAEFYARRVRTEMERNQITPQSDPALTALKHIEAHCRSARADIFTIDLSPPRGE